MEDAAQNRTTITYDPETGRKIAETNALSKSTRYAYNIRSQVTHTWGDNAYPVAYHYDAFGRMIQMTTFRTKTTWNANTWPSGVTGDTTTWDYDEATGLLASKTDADGNAVTYNYDESGKLDERTWARLDSSNPLTTDYAYNSSTGELTGIDYSDTTPDITFAYDRLGRKTGILDATGSRTFAYTDNLQLESETMTGMVNRTLARTYDASDATGRNTGFLINGYGVNYGYDAFGRMNTVGWDISGNTGDSLYAYVADSNLLASVSVNGNFQTAYSYEDHRNLKTAIQNTFAPQIVSAYDYEYDELGRRTSVVNTGTAFVDDALKKYSYNDRNELTESERFMGTDPDNITQPVEPEYRAYDFDAIGNRNNATEGSESKSYAANSLNQYEEVTAGGETTTLSYDADGNITVIPAKAGIQSAGGQMLLSYNAENRLVRVEPETPSDGDKRLEFTYDYMGRRVKKAVYDYSAGSWNLEKELLFVYDGWNLIEEITDDGTTQTSRYFVWGLDLSQSLQGAGGIGGLLATVDGSDTYYFAYDGNGNVGQVVNATDGTIAASYQYDPFGNLIKSDGAYADDNPFRFSTKYHDDETGLVYYGYRYYSPELGRWINRDPIEESGGINLYRFAGNNALNSYDPNGLSIEWIKSKYNEVTEELSNLIDSAEEKALNALRQTWNDILETARTIRKKAKRQSTFSNTIQERRKIPVGLLWEWNYGFKGVVKESPCDIQIQAGLFGGGRLKTPKVIWGARIIIAFSVNGTINYD